MHLGDHNIIAGVSECDLEDKLSKFGQNLKTAFKQSDIPKCLGIIQEHCGDNVYSLKHIFRDEQRKIIDTMLNSFNKEACGALRRINSNYYPFIQALGQINIPTPPMFALTAGFVANNDLIEILRSQTLDIENLNRVAADCRKWHLQLDTIILAYVASTKINDLIEQFCSASDTNAANDAISILTVLKGFDLALDIWKAQNLFFEFSRKLKSDASFNGKFDQVFWRESFNSLGELLGVKIMEV
jgi:hypothetical protein